MNMLILNCTIVVIVYTLMIYKKRIFFVSNTVYSPTVTIVYEGELRVEENCISCIN